MRVIASWIIGLAIAVVVLNVKADQVIFSQYDGVNTWNNVYIEIEDAKAFADANPGVAYALPTAHIETQAQEEIESREAKDGHWEMRNIYNDDRQVWTKGQNDELWTRASNGAKKHTGQLMSRENQIRYETVTRTWRSKAIEGREAVAHNVEQAMLPRAIVAVPTDVDMEAFIKDFFL